MIQSIVFNSRILLFVPATFFNKTVGYKLDGEPHHLITLFDLSGLKRGRSKSDPAFEKTGKWRDAAKSDREANLSHGITSPKQLFCIFNTHTGQILTWRFSVNRSEEPEKMKAREAGFTGDIVQIDRR